ncbi:hypothetical protein [Oleisolibacter albus]|uniref:hypothetical protein n=1 Tax=Oleisolibacter albus TaxID=2171757 RepID=UPI000DF498D2|nr:hypothetical protein [Oleisolibacter albus]
MDFDRATLVGRVETVYELHSLHGDAWLLVKEHAGLHALERQGALLAQRNEVDGVRVVRRLDYVDHGFRTVVTLSKRLRPGVQETDPLAVAHPGRDVSWCDGPEDLLSDAARQLMRSFLGRYLDEQRVTPLEVLSYEVPARALDSAGTVLQGALQRIASLQVRGTRQTAAARMKALLAVIEAGLGGLNAAARAGAPPPIPADGLAALSAALPAGEAGVRALFRAVAAHLAPATTWVDKLDRLFRLWSRTLTVREMRVLDSLAAEILASPSALKALAGEQQTRLALVLNAIDLHAGHLGGGGTALPPGVKCLSTLLAAGVLPRTLAELRHGLLRHLHARLPLGSNGGLRDEMRATAQVLAHLRRHDPSLAEDEEVVEALSVRAGRLIQPEAVSDLVTPVRTILGRAELLLDLAAETPGEAAKAKLMPYLRPFVAPEDIVREQGNRMEAIKPLAGLASRLAAADLPAVPRREMLEILDSALFELIRAEILANTALAFTDRMLALLRLCPGLPEGRARQLATDQLTQALKRPEFILHYLERFTSVQARRDAFFGLCNTMLESGLVDRSLVPMAA